MRALAVSSLALAGCGGGGSSTPPSPQQPPAALRTDLLFGYYGAVDQTIPEVAGHVNLAWVMGWGSHGAWLENVTAQLVQARQNGIRAVILHVPQAYNRGGTAESDVRYVFQSLLVQGLLDNIVALYPIDEPDVAHRSDAEVTAANVMLRRVMADFPSLHDTKLAVIYSAGNDRPGIASYDWVGFDDYNKRCDALGDGYTALKARLRPEQRLIVVPGGADPWDQDPSCFFARAQVDQQVIAIVPFIWFDDWEDVTNAGGGPRGIRSNGMANVYCITGRRTVTADPRADCA
jgi:hypothetical protein